MDERDSLTQILNRQAFDVFLESALGDAGRFDEPLSLVMADIDHFKRVNDGHGHLTGDAVLKGVAGRLDKVSRQKGKAFRYGGDELALVLPNHSAQEGVAVAERARREIEATPINGIHVTVSLGVGSFPDHAANATTLIQAADDALYDAKNRGHDVVRSYREPEPTKPGPREAERKVPEAGRLTEQQKTELRRRHLRGERIECPDDGAYLKVHDATCQGSIGSEFIIVCPDCGMSETLSGGRR